MCVCVSTGDLCVWVEFDTLKLSDYKLQEYFEINIKIQRKYFLMCPSSEQEMHFCACVNTETQKGVLSVKHE